MGIKLQESNNKAYKIYKLASECKNIDSWITRDNQN